MKSALQTKSLLVAALSATVFSSWQNAALAQETKPEQTIDPALKAAAKMSGSVMYANAGAPGLILAVVRGDDVFVGCYGETAPGNSCEPNSKSIFRLASISKVFAGEVLADMVAEGKVGLADPLAKFAPDGITLKNYGKTPVTLLDLVTHGAGLPRECIDPSVPEGKGNPFDACNTKYYWAWMAANAPSYEPGTTTIYSNMAFGLLGEALAKAGGKPYSELLKEHISAPLAMPDTVFKLTSEQKGRLMIGLNDANKPDANWSTPEIMDASGGLYSTADDMVRWMRAQTASPLTASMAMQHALWRPHDGQKRVVGVRATSTEGMGLGWTYSRAHDRIPALLSKSGAVGGFMSHVAISPNRKIGIFVAVNRVNFAMLDEIQKSIGTLAAELSAAEN